MSKRTDIHRPAEFDPADYRVVDYLDNKRPEFPIWAAGSARAKELYDRAVADWQARIFEHFPNWRSEDESADHRGIFQCAHCGHNPIRWVAVVEHVPTGNRLAFGEICADRVELSGRDAFRAKFVKTESQRREAHFEKQLRELTWRIEHVEVTDWLDAQGEDAHEFICDMKDALAKYGELTERQLAAVEKWMKREQERQARREQEREELAAVEPLPEGRYVIEGEVLSHKWQDGYYGSVHKMLIRMDDGNKVWGTVPESIQDALDVYERDANGDVVHAGHLDLKGRRVRLTAQVERSHDDEHFGFYKRPMKAELIEAVTA